MPPPRPGGCPTSPGPSRRRSRRHSATPASGSESWPRRASAFRAARLHVSADRLRTADLLRKEAEVDQRLNRLPQALRTLSRALALLDGAASDDTATLAERSRVAGLYAVVRQNQGRYRDSIAWGRRAEADAVAALDMRAMADAYEALHGSFSMLGVVPEQPYGELALAMYTELDDRAAVSTALNNLAIEAWLAGRGRDALEMFARAETAAAEAGDTLGAASSRYNVGDVLLRQGRLNEAETILRDVLLVLRSLGANDFSAAALRGLGLVQAHAGDAQGAGARLAEARSVLESMGQTAEVVETDAAIAESLLIERSSEEAAAVSAEAIRRAESLHAGYLLPTLHRLHGAALADSGELEAARVALTAALHACETHGRAERGFILAELARLLDRSSAAQTAAESEQALDLLGFVGSARYPRSGP